MGHAGRPRKRFSEIWNGKVFYGGDWRRVDMVKRILPDALARYYRLKKNIEMRKQDG